VRTFDYLPGQFQFVTFFRNRDLPVEEHHWTISSSPTERRYVSSTIKELGDFTSSIGKTKPRDTAAVHAPFGRFSYILHPNERDLVFIVGGIGITPLMSMLRHMRETQSENHVLLLYANKTEEDIVFRRELREIEAGGHPRLTTVHILSKASEKWQGETGYIDSEKIRRFCGNPTEKTFYLCGPEALVDGVATFLRSEGVQDSHMHREIFSLVK
jgi:predicted ferric reductase